MERDSSDIIMSFGRFHPLILHIPIGFLLVAFILELMSRRPRFRRFGFSIGFVLLLRCISASLAALLGLMLASGGGYQERYLSYHQSYLTAVFGVVGLLKQKSLAYDS